MSKHLPALLASFALALLAGLSTAASAPAAAPPGPANLRVLGGEESWHAENGFRLDWDNPAGAPVAAVGYRVRDAAGVVVLGGRVPWRTDSIGGIHLPGPGRYVAEVWLESALGEQSPPASATLRFDDVRPGDVEARLPFGWVGEESAPLLRLDRPAPPHPISGIRGYAISLDPTPEASPCLDPDRCSDAETDLRGGIDADSVRLQRLPEGTTFVHAVAVSGAGVRSARVGTAVVRVDTTPPSVALKGVPAEWVGRAVTVTAVATDARSGMSGGSAGAFTALAVDGAVPAIAPGGSVGAVVAGEGVHTVAAHASDAAGNIGGDGSGNGSLVGLVRIDRTPPRIAFAASLDSSDPELLEARIADGLAGPDPSRGSIAIRPRRSHRQFAPLPTTISGDRLLARWDSDRYPPGMYEFRATGYDGAGNVASSQRRVNGTTLVLPAPLKAATELQAGFGGGRLVWHRCNRSEERRRCRREVVKAFEQRPAERTVPFGRGITVGGMLTAAAGAPVAGLPVQVVEIFDAGDEPQRQVQTIETESDGSFLARLAPGPGRQIEFAFAGTRTLAGAAARPARLAVRAGVRMHASSSSARIGGRPVVFSGDVEDEAAISPSGKAVELQFRLPGLPWTQFRTIQTDARGRFRYPYRFSDDDSHGVRFQIRAFVPAEERWPYEPAGSRPVAVWGR